MEGDTPQVPVTQEVQPEAKGISQTPQQPPVVPQTPPPPAGGPTPPTKSKKWLKTKILVILIILVALGIGGSFVWKNISVPETEKTKEEKTTDEEIYIYKGIWTPALLFRDPNYLASNIQKLKDIGINTVFIVGSPPQSEQVLEIAKKDFPPELIERIKEILPVEKTLIINNIQTAHRNGLKVGLTIVNPPPEMEDLDVELLNSKIIEYARLAEEYDVELFAPMGEPGKIFGKNTGRWRQEILLKIKEVYHGEIVWKGAGVSVPDKATISEIPKQPPGDFSGYDYIGFSSMLIPKGGLTPEEQLQFADQLTLESYSQYVDNVLKYELALAERDGVKGVMITEFGVLEGETWNEEEIARAHEIVLERGKGKVVGFFANSFFLGVELPGMIVEEEPKTEEVIRGWFTEILPEEK